MLTYSFNVLRQTILFRLIHVLDRGRFLKKPTLREHI